MCFSTGEHEKVNFGWRWAGDFIAVRIAMRNRFIVWHSNRSGSSLAKAFLPFRK
jgi:hypothetical protein